MTAETIRARKQIEAETAAHRSVVHHHKDYNTWVASQIESHRHAQQHADWALRRDCLGLAFRWFEGIASPRGLYIRPEDEPPQPSWSAVIELADNIEQWIRGEQ